MSTAVRYSSFGILLVLTDYLTKMIAREHCLVGHSYGPFVCELVMNPGISWGLLPAHGWWSWVGLVSITLAVFAILLVYTMRQFFARRPIWGEVAVLAGALGNVCDRIFFGAVIDFLTIKPILGYHFFTCNVADVCITLGVVWIVYEDTWGSC